MPAAKNSQRGKKAQSPERGSGMSVRSIGCAIAGLCVLLVSIGVYCASNPGPSKSRGKTGAAANSLSFRPAEGAENIDQCSRHAREPKWAELWRWLEDTCGVKDLRVFYKAEFNKSGAMVTGVGVKIDIPKGAKFGCVPQHCWIAAYGAPLEKVCGEGVVAVALAEEEELGAASKFEPYLDSMPTEEDYRQFHPGYYVGELNLAPEHDPWSDSRGAWYTALRRCREIHNKRFPDKKVSWEAALLGAVREHSRGFSIELPSAPNLFSAMVPLLDLANTGPPRMLNVEPMSTIKENQYMTCFSAMRDIAAGEELINDYSTKHLSALAFLQTYGFTFGPREHPVGASDPRMCQGIPSRESPEGGATGSKSADDESPILENYRRFFDDHCAGGAGSSATPSSGKKGRRRRQRGDGKATHTEL